MDLASNLHSASELSAWPWTVIHLSRASVFSPVEWDPNYFIYLLGCLQIPLLWGTVQNQILSMHQMFSFIFNNFLKPRTKKLIYL